MSEPGFPQFCQLPQELQDRIWDTAIRPAPAPAAHRFIIHGQAFLNPTISVFSIRGNSLRLGTGYTLFVPWDDNDSVYALDSALWTTCLASRAALRRRFKKNEWWADTYIEHPGELPKKLAERGHYGDEGGVAHTASYADATGHLRYVTFLDEDLIHLDPLGIDSVNWFHHYASDNLPLVNYRGLDRSNSTASFLPLNLAIDYDPAMLHVMEGRPVHRCIGPLKMSQPSILDMVTLLHELAGRTLWFVDHRLQKRDVDSNLPPPPSSNLPAIKNIADNTRKEFYSADAIFVEVRREDMRHWEIDSDDNSPFEFLDSLRSHIEDLSGVKILACQLAPGKPPKKEFPKNPEGGCDLCNPPPPIRMRPRAPPPDNSDDDSITSADVDLLF